MAGTRGVNSTRYGVHTTFSLTLTVRSVMLRPCTGLDHAHSDCSQAATSYHHCAESRPASCSHWRSHERCTVVSAFAIAAPTRHEKMIYARKARFPHAFCTCGTCLHQKRCASLPGAVPSAENHMCSCPAECHKATLRHVCTTAAVVQLHRARRL